jgi:hypothetical protein
MRIVNLQLVLVGVATAALCGCNGVLGVDGPGQQPGVISFYSDPVVVEVPDTVTRGQPFAVSVRTYGGGCVSQGPTDVRVDDLRATITPFDINSGHDFCTAALRLFQHEASITFDRAGIATVVFRGTRRPEDQPIAVERTVVVR